MVTGEAKPAFDHLLFAASKGSPTLGNYRVLNLSLTALSKYFFQRLRDAVINGNCT